MTPQADGAPAEDRPSVSDAVPQDASRALGRGRDETPAAPPALAVEGVPPSRAAAALQQPRREAAGRVRHSVVTALALVVGVALLVVALVQADLRSLGALSWQLGAALPLALLPSAAWHVVRARAWQRCFPASAAPSFARLFRVRLAAEAVSFVTIRGVAGEPLKVVLLEREVAPMTSAAAVALERLAYILVTAVIVAIAAGVAVLTLPLSREWLRIFGIIATAAVVVIAVPAVLLMRPAPRDVRPGRASSAVARFFRELDIQARALVFGDRRRLASLLGLEAASYALMAVEVWVVLWAARTPIDAISAIAVETFTRVASMVSSFIPANLGALEASQVAAAAAVHATGGAAALALVRRLRGLIWCAAGFVVYPRLPDTRARRDADSDDAVVVVMEDRSRPSEVTAIDRLGGLMIGERRARAAERAGYQRLLTWAPGGGSTLAVEALAWLAPRMPVTVLAPGVVASPALLAAAREITPTEGEALVEVPAGPDWPCSGVFRTTAAQLARRGADVPFLRARTGPEPTGRDVACGRAALSLRVRTREELADAEGRLRESIFKPTDAYLARVNRRLSLPISVALIRAMRLSPHVMSVCIIGLGLYAGWLFSVGSYATGVAAALVSLAASILDGCDGELARLQYRESAFGCWLDTLGDYSYYVSIFTGLAIGAARQGEWWGWPWVGGALLAGVFLTFAVLIVLRRRITGGRPERLRTTTRAHFQATGKRWARLVVPLSTVATRATMPYGIVVFAVAGLLPWLLVLATIGAHLYWMSLAHELRRLLDGARPLVAESAKSVEPAF